MQAHFLEKLQTEVRFRTRLIIFIKTLATAQKLMKHCLSFKNIFSLAIFWRLRGYHVTVLALIVRAEFNPNSFNAQSAAARE